MLELEEKALEHAETAARSAKQAQTEVTRLSDQINNLRLEVEKVKAKNLELEQHQKLILDENHELRGRLQKLEKESEDRKRLGSKWVERLEALEKGIGKPKWDVWKGVPDEAHVVTRRNKTLDQDVFAVHMNGKYICDDGGYRTIEDAKRVRDALITVREATKPRKKGGQNAAA